MNKMAIYAEGRTEVEFDSKLILELASPKAITIESRKLRGGSTVPFSSQRITVRQSISGQESTHFFMLYDCANDRIVKDRMVDDYPTLCNAGYTKILCHRDVAPTYARADIPKLEGLLRYGVRSKPIVVTFVLSVMEVEAWFLAEHLHFP